MHVSARFAARLLALLRVERLTHGVKHKVPVKPGHQGIVDGALNATPAACNNRGLDRGHRGLALGLLAAVRRPCGSPNVAVQN